MAAKSTSKAGRKKPFTPERRNLWLIVLTALLVIASIFVFTPLQNKINLGLDLQGGLSVVLTASTTDGSDVTADQMESSRAVIESRVNALGVSEATVQVQGTNQILVQIPGLSDAETALEVIGQTGTLEFARLDSFTDSTTQLYIEYGWYATEETYTDDYGNSFPTGEYTYLEVEAGTYTTLFTGDNIESVSVDRESETSTYYAVNITLDDEATAAFAEATADLASDNGQIVIILDGEVRSAPAVQSVISDGQVAITGNYTQAEAQALATILESGSLPVSFEYSQSQVVGPTLGQDALAAGVLVAVVGLLLVLIYLICFYRGLGLITAAEMAVFAVIYLGVLAALSQFGLFSLSLAGIAGVVLTIGMAADAAILVMERFREEIRMGRSIRAASLTGVKHGIMTAIDADLVSLVSALALFFLATATVKGFGLTLALGIVCNIITMLIFMMPLMRLLAPRLAARFPKFWDIEDCQNLAEVEREGRLPERIKGRFVKRDINFLGHRRKFLIVAGVMIVAVFVVVGLRGLNFGIEFQGGTSITFNDTGDVTIEELREAFAEAGEDDLIIQTTTTDDQSGFLVRSSNTSADDAASVANVVAAQFGWEQDSYEVTTIGPDWGTSVIQSSLIALAVSFILIIAYIAIRFEYKMGLCAIAALIHDILIVVGIYALVGREVTPNAVAALLTILGFSLYDKVVVFHRINENMKAGERSCTFMTMANHSINQVIIRTVNTSLSALIPVVAMLLFGGETLRDFAFAMTIGLICGAYSTISVASPLYCIWKTREPKNARLVKRFGPEVQRMFLGYLPNDSRLAQMQEAARALDAVEAELCGVQEAADDTDSAGGAGVGADGAAASALAGADGAAAGASGASGAASSGKTARSGAAQSKKQAGQQPRTRSQLRQEQAKRARKKQAKAANESSESSSNGSPDDNEE